MSAIKLENVVILTIAAVTSYAALGKGVHTIVGKRFLSLGMNIVFVVVVRKLIENKSGDGTAVVYTM